MIPVSHPCCCPGSTPAPLGCAHISVTLRMDTGEIQLMLYALLPCSSPKKTPESKSCSTCWHHKFLCLLNPAGCTKLSAFAAQVISALGIISTDNVHLKLPHHLPQRGLKVPSVFKIQPHLNSRCTVQLFP